MSQESLDHSVRGGAGAGNYKSTGSLSPASPEAIRKLASSGPAGNEWLLKAVQAAVAAGCHRLHFKFNRKTTVVVFSSPGTSELRQVARTLLDPDLPAEPFAQQLNPGLRSLLRWHRFTLEGCCGTRLEWDGRRLDQKRVAPRDNLRFETCRRDGEKDRRREIIDSERLLTRRAIYAPLELFIDGRRICPETVPLNQRLPGHRKVFGKTLLLVYQDPDCDDSREWRRPPQRSSQDRLRSQAPYLSLGKPEAHPEQRHFELLSKSDPKRNPRTPSADRQGAPDKLFIQLSKLGVVCESWQLPASSPALFHAPVNHVDTDPTGLKLQEQQSARDQIQQDLPRLAGPLEKLEIFLEKHQPHENRELPESPAQTRPRVAEFRLQLQQLSRSQRQPVELDTAL